MNIYNFFDKKILNKTLPFYFPIILGIFYKLNTIALFVIPIHAIRSISLKRFSPRLKQILEIFNIPIPDDNNLLSYFFLLILLGLITLIFSNILKKLFILRIKKNIINTNKIKKIKIKNKFRYYTKKFEKINNYIGIVENIIFCIILVFIIIFLDYQIALITLFGGLSYLFIVKKLRLFRFQSKKEIFESLALEDKRKKYFNLIIQQFSKDQKLTKAIASTIIMLIILFAIFKRSEPEISIIFIFLVRIFQSEMIGVINKFVAEKRKNTKKI